MGSGCKHTVAGEAWHTEARRWLAQYHLTPERSPCSDRFRFGDGNVVQAACTWTYPAGVYGQNGTLRVAEVPVDCPPLLSVKSMRELGVCLDFEQGETRVGGKTRPMESMETGRPKLHIEDYDWNKYWLSDTEYQSFCVEDVAFEGDESWPEFDPMREPTG